MKIQNGGTNQRGLKYIVHFNSFGGEHSGKSPGPRGAMFREPFYDIPDTSQLMFFVPQKHDRWRSLRDAK